METQDKIIINIILCLVFFCNISCGQNKAKPTIRESENSIRLDENLPCIDSILQVKYEVENSICISTDIKKYRELIENNEGVKNWLFYMNEEELSAYTINKGKDAYLILISTPIGVTGITTNFYFWLLIDYNKGTILKEIVSLSQNTRSWFVKDDKIHFVAFEFGNEFYHGERDYAKLPIKVIEYILSEDDLKEISSTDVKVSGN